MKIKLAFVAATVVALVVACVPSEKPVTYGGFPHCGTLPTEVSCVEPWSVDSEGVGEGVLFYPDGQASLINFWGDGSFELFDRP